MRDLVSRTHCENHRSEHNVWRWRFGLSCQGYDSEQEVAAVCCTKRKSRSIRVKAARRTCTKSRMLRDSNILLCLQYHLNAPCCAMCADPRHGCCSSHPEIRAPGGRCGMISALFTFQLVSSQHASSTHASSTTSFPFSAPPAFATIVSSSASPMTTSLVATSGPALFMLLSTTALSSALLLLSVGRVDAMASLSLDRC